jgi:hypothetical protein
MNDVNILTDKELVDRYWHSDDPVISRLCEIADRYQQMTRHLPRHVEFSELLGWNVDGCPLGSYIDGLIDERDAFEYEVLELQGKVNKLSARTVSELLGAMEGKLRDRSIDINDLKGQLKRAEAREQAALSKLDTWTSLTKDYGSGS